MGRTPTVYNDVRCIRKPDGKWRCNLFTSPMYEDIPDVTPLTVKTPEGPIEIPASQMEMGVRILSEPQRTKEVVDNLDEIVSYGCHAVTIESNEVVIQPSNAMILTKFGDHTELGAHRTTKGRTLYLKCDLPRVQSMRGI